MKRLLLVLCVALFLLPAGCTTKAKKLSSAPEDYSSVKAKIVEKYSARQPAVWGENITRVVTRFNTDKKEIALTFDACGGSHGSGYNKKLMDFLINEQIPATLFINARWIDANPEIFASLSSSNLFEIESHGLNHKPCSATGNSAYRIKGTSGIGEVVDEVEIPARKIEVLTGKKVLYYRPGTANCDDICVDVAAMLGYKIAGFSVNGDYGATANARQVAAELESAKPGDIVLMHMNHPESKTAEGVMTAIPELIKSGFVFVKLEDFKQNN